MKSLDKEWIISKDANSLRKEDTDKHKCFICHASGCFAKGCPKSRKVKMVAPTSKETMACYDAISNPHPTTDEILKSASNIEKGTSKDIFINRQPQSFVSIQLYDNDLYASEFVKDNEDDLHLSI